jgi:hypothetical protein
MKKPIDKEQKYKELDEMFKRKLFFGIDFYEFEERAAIMEFEGNMKAELAATLAFNDITKNYAYSKGQIK